MNKIRQDVSSLYGVHIPEGRWEDYLEMLDRDGHPNRKELCKLVLIFGKHIEELENELEKLTSKK